MRHFMNILKENKDIFKTELQLNYIKLKFWTLVTQNIRNVKTHLDKTMKLIQDNQTELIY